MGYNCVVCIKQVPDTKKVTGDAMKEDGTVNRTALPLIFNPEDLHALELALEVRDQHGGTVTVLTMGAPMAAEVLREALYRGADRVLLLTDRKAAASDTLATSYILSCAVKKLDADLIFCGRQAIDGDTAQVGPQLADKLEMNLVTYVEDLQELNDSALKARRNVGTGWEIVSCKLPALLTVMDTTNTPRPRAAKRIMKCKKARCAMEVAKEVEADLGDAKEDARAKEIDQRCKALAEKGLLIEAWGLADIDAKLDWCGRQGSPTKVHRIQSVVLSGGEYHEFPPSEEGISELIGALIEEHTLG